MERTTIDLWFGAFVTAGFVALLVLALKVGNLGAERATETYRVESRFDNIGGLKVRGIQIHIPHDAPRFLFCLRNAL